MEIIKSFALYKDAFINKKHIVVKLELRGDEGYSLNIFNIKEQMLTIDEEFIEAKNIVDSEFLQEHDIEFIRVDNKIIPVGLIEFKQGHSRNMDYMPIVMDTIKEQCEIHDILQQIEIAIKYKYNGKLVLDKCSGNVKETIQL